ncbi:MAG: recombinase family protein [Acidimicrobiia bacterium]
MSPTTCAHGQPSEAAVRAAVYARVSTDEQAEHGTSLDEQVRRCEAYCAAHGWTVVAIYREQGVSGSRASRPELDQLMRSARSREVDAIVVAKLDRWGRSMRHLCSALGDLDDWQIRFASVAEAIDSSTASGRLLRNVLGAIAEFEREAIVERTSSGLRAVARGGWWPGGPPPYGYRVEKSANRARLVIHEDEATVIRAAVEFLVDRRMTTWQAAQELNALALHPRRSPRWTHHNLRRQLLDAKGLSGRWPYRRPGRANRSVGEEIEVEIPAILTPERHELLRTALARTSRGPGATARKSTYLLVGRIHSACGGTMHGVRRRDRNTRVYRCLNDRAEAYERCECRRCDADSLESVVWSEVLSVLTDPDRIVALAQTALDARGPAEAVEGEDIHALDRRIARLERALGSTVADLLRRGMDPAVITVASAELDADLVRLREHRARVATWQEVTREKADRMQRLWELARRARELLATPTPEMQRRILDLLDVRVRVVGWELCELCAGRGFVSAGFDARSRPRGSTGVVCASCRRHRFVPVIEIAGVVPDQVSLDPGDCVLAAGTYPFQIHAAG